RVGKDGVPVSPDTEPAALALGRRADRIANPPLGVPPLPPATRASAPISTDYFGVRQFLAEAGVPFVEARPADSEASAIAAAAAIGYPVVLKSLGATHKSDGGGVRLGNAGEAQRKGA